MPEAVYRHILGLLQDAWPDESLGSGRVSLCRDEELRSAHSAFQSNLDNQKRREAERKAEQDRLRRVEVRHSLAQHCILGFMPSTEQYICVPPQGAACICQVLLLLLSCLQAEHKQQQLRDLLFRKRLWRAGDAEGSLPLTLNPKP